MTVPASGPSTTRCETTELLIDQCGCRVHAGRGGRPARGLTAETEPYARHGGGSPTYGPEIEARFGGRCPECGERYEPMDPIRPQRSKSVGINTGRWVHAECAEEQS